MLVVDASCLVEVVTGASRAEAVREHFAADPDQAAPHLIDAEVFGVVRKQYLRGDLDETAARQAVSDLATWGAERFSHRPLLARAWELRRSVGGMDAMYVALAEALGISLLTMDRRLGRASDVRCSLTIVD